MKYAMHYGFLWNLFCYLIVYWSKTILIEIEKKRKRKSIINYIPTTVLYSNIFYNIFKKM